MSFLGFKDWKECFISSCIVACTPFVLFFPLYPIIITSHFKIKGLENYILLTIILYPLGIGLLKILSNLIKKYDINTASEMLR